MYIKPYHLDERMATALCEGRGIAVDHTNFGNAFRVINNAIDSACVTVKDAEFDVLDANWSDGDVSMSEKRIPEPTSQGAIRLAEAIEAEIVQK